MPDTIRQQIISTVDTRFKTILVANGYQTNLGDHVFEWRTKENPLSASELDGLIYRDTDEEKIEGAGSNFENTVKVEIEISSTSPSQIRKCLADLEKAAFVDRFWNGLAIRTRLSGNKSAKTQKENIFVASQVILEIDYLTVMGDPYTKGH